MLVSEQGRARLFLLLNLHGKRLPDGRTGLDHLLTMKPADGSPDWLIGAVDQLLAVQQARVV